MIEEGRMSVNMVRIHLQKGIQIIRRMFQTFL